MKLGRLIGLIVVVIGAILQQLIQAGGFAGMGFIIGFLVVWGGCLINLSSK